MFASGGEVTDEERAEYDDQWEVGQAPLNEDSAAAKMQMFMDYLGKIEKKHSCSGVCNKWKIYYFSDINNGIPT